MESPFQFLRDQHKKTEPGKIIGLPPKALEAMFSKVTCREWTMLLDEYTGEQQQIVRDSGKRQIEIRRRYFLKHRYRRAYWLFLVIFLLVFPFLNSIPPTDIGNWTVQIVMIPLSVFQYFRGEEQTLIPVGQERDKLEAELFAEWTNQREALVATGLEIDKSETNKAVDEHRKLLDTLS